jgi:hypothetical protein
LKKLFSILFLSVHFFNTCGYQLFFSAAENIANKHMIASLDKNKYNENELIQVKCALNAPYIINNISYERCDGQIELNGVQYNYVKRMVRNDTLYLYCIPNHQKTELNNTRNLYAKQNSDNPSGKTSEQNVLKKINLINEYNSNELSFNFHPYQSPSDQGISFNNLTTLKGFTAKHLQPPDLFI